LLNSLVKEKEKPIANSTNTTLDLNFLKKLKRAQFLFYANAFGK